MYPPVSIYVFTCLSIFQCEKNILHTINNGWLVHLLIGIRWKMHVCDSSYWNVWMSYETFPKGMEAFRRSWSPSIWRRTISYCVTHAKPFPLCIPKFPSINRLYKYFTFCAPQMHLRYQRRWEKLRIQEFSTVGRKLPIAMLMCYEKICCFFDIWSIIYKFCISSLLFFIKNHSFLLTIVLVDVTNFLWFP